MKIVCEAPNITELPMWEQYAVGMTEALMYVSVFICITIFIYITYERYKHDKKKK